MELNVDDALARRWRARRKGINTGLVSRRNALPFRTITLSSASPKPSNLHVPKSICPPSVLVRYPYPNEPPPLYDQDILRARPRQWSNTSTPQHHHHKTLMANLTSLGPSSTNRSSSTTATLALQIIPHITSMYLRRSILRPKFHTRKQDLRS